MKREMKHSSIEWAGDVPKHWQYIKLKSYYAFEKGKKAQLYTVDYIGSHEGEYPVYSGQTENDGVLGRIDTYDYDVDECLFSTTVGAKVMTPKILSGKFSLSQNCLIMKKIKECNNHFMFYCLHPLFDYEKGSIPSYMQPSLRIDDLKKFGFFIPLDIKEQERIADYLDKKCADIESLALNIQKEIEQLEEYKRSIIVETVTKGLNLNVNLIDSQIPYIGMIPSTYEIKPLYLYFDERKNSNKLLKEDNLLSLSYGRIVKKDINTLGGLLPESFSTYNIVEANEIIIRPTDLQNDKKSLRTGLCKEHGIITSAYIALKPKYKFDTRFFHYQLHAFDVMKVFYNMGNGVRQGLNYSEFSKLMLLIPGAKEQIEIADYLDAKCKEIDSIKESKNEQLEKVYEYKKALVYEYATGKKEVPINE